MIEITEQVFLLKVNEENCGSAVKAEYMDAVSPKFLNYRRNALELISKKVFSLWRINKEGDNLIDAYETSHDEAFPMSFIDLSQKPTLFMNRFDNKKDYL